MKFYEKTKQAFFQMGANWSTYLHIAAYFGIAIVSNSPTPQIEYSEINDNLLPAFKISKISSMTIGNSMTVGKNLISN